MQHAIHIASYPCRLKPGYEATIHKYGSTYFPFVNKTLWPDHERGQSSTSQLYSSLILVLLTCHTARQIIFIMLAGVICCQSYIFNLYNQVLLTQCYFVQISCSNTVTYGCLFMLLHKIPAVMHTTVILMNQIRNDSYTFSHRYIKHYPKLN